MSVRHLWLGLAWLCWSSLAIAAEQPNILFLLVDDLGYADCGFNGGQEIHTPHIDALAKAGTVLEAHYVQPVCSPTRSTLMTGRYPTRTGVYTVVRPHAKWGLPLEERTLATALKEAGYTTAITGKWHLGEFERSYLPTSRGFDHQYGHYFGALDYFAHTRDESHDWYRNDVELNEEGYTTHLLAQEACHLIQQQDHNKPLFLYVPFNGVHSPLQVPDQYLEPYGNLEGPRQKLAGMLAAVDEAIGQIVAALEETGLRKNTLIVFSSDNGGPKPGTNTPLRGYKGGLYEGGIRSAAFVNWPGQIPAGVRLAEPMHMADWYPTLIGLAGGDLQQSQPLDGQDVWPMLTQRARSPHSSILVAQSPQQAAVRAGNWKLIKQVPPPQAKSQNDREARKTNQDRAPTFELYNLQTDLEEQQNLAESEPQRLQEMQALLHQLLQNAVPLGQQP